MDAPDCYDTTEYEPEQIYLDRDGCPQTPYQRLHRVLEHTDPMYPQPELKATSFNFSVLLTTPNFSVTVLNQLTLGTGLQSRIGNQVFTRGVFWNFFPYLPPQTSVATIPPNLRLQLIWDRQSNANVPTATDIYQNPASS